MDNDFHTLRSALIGDELKHLELLSAQFNDKVVYTSRMSDSLPVAIVQSASESDNLVNAMKLPVLNSFHLAVESHREQVKQMLAPVIMPVIGQAVAQATMEIKDTIETLTSSMFTVQGIKWRIESAKTGRPYSEIAFKDKHQFTIDQLTLSAKRNGEVLNQTAKQSYTDSSDITNQNLIKQHIHAVSQRVTITADKEPLDTKTFDAFTSYTVHGVWCALTAVVSGSANEEFLFKLRKQIKAIEADANAALKAYRDDTSVFEPLKKPLNQLLDFVPSKPVPLKSNQASGGFSLAKLFLYSLLILFIAYIGFLLYSHYEKNKIIHALNQEKGFVTLEVDGNAYSGWHIKGMQDPHIFNPQKLALDETVRTKLMFNSVPFVSLSKESMLARLNKKLPQPAGVQYAIADTAPNTLLVTGVADDAWVAKLKQLASTVEGIDSVDASAVTAKVDDKADYEAAKKALESLTFVFPNKSTEFGADQSAALEQAKLAMKTLSAAGDKLKLATSYRVSTFVSGSSPRSDNAKLLYDRFIAVKQHFGEQGIDPAAFQFVEQVEQALDLPAATIRVNSVSR